MESFWLCEECKHLTYTGKPHKECMSLLGEDMEDVLENEDCAGFEPR